MTEKETLEEFVATMIGGNGPQARLIAYQGLFKLLNFKTISTLRGDEIHVSGNDADKGILLAYLITTAFNLGLDSKENESPCCNEISEFVRSVLFDDGR